MYVSRRLGVKKRKKRKKEKKRKMYVLYVRTVRIKCIYGVRLYQSVDGEYVYSTEKVFSFSFLFLFMFMFMSFS